MSLLRLRDRRDVDALGEQLDQALAPPRVLRGDRDQVSALHVEGFPKVIGDIDRRKVAKEELFEEVALVKVDLNKLDVAILRYIFSTEQPFQSLDLVLGVVIGIGVTQGGKGCLLVRSE